MKQRAEIASIVSPRDGNDNRETESINSRGSWPRKKTPIIPFDFFLFFFFSLVVSRRKLKQTTLFCSSARKNILPRRTGGFSGRDETRKTRNARCRFQRIHYRTFTSITEFPFCRLDRDCVSVVVAIRGRNAEELLVYETSDLAI